jgi:hypothetical protein
MIRSSAGSKRRTFTGRRSVAAARALVPCRSGRSPRIASAAPSFAQADPRAVVRPRRHVPHALRPRPPTRSPRAPPTGHCSDRRSPPSSGIPIPAARAARALHSRRRACAGRRSLARILASTMPEITLALASCNAPANRSLDFSTRIRIPETIRYLKPLNSKSASKIAL